MADETIDHVAGAIGRLREQFKDKPNIVALLSALVRPSQAIENTLQDMLVFRTVDRATGVNLDRLGKIVGQPRNGLVDDDYRRYIRARIAANRSRGTVNDILKVARLIVYSDDASLEIDQQGTAAFVIRVVGVTVDPSLAAILLAFLKASKSAGVRVILEVAQNLPGGIFKLDDGPGFDDPSVVLADGYA
jgi:hypothetical protein